MLELENIYALLTADVLDVKVNLFVPYQISIYQLVETYIAIYMVRSCLFPFSDPPR